MLAAWRSPSRCARLKSMSFIIWKAACSHARRARGRTDPRGSPRCENCSASALETLLQPFSLFFPFSFSFFFLFFTRQTEEESSLLRGRAAEGAHLSPLARLPTALSSSTTPDAKSATHARRAVLTFDGGKKNSLSILFAVFVGLFLN